MRVAITGSSGMVGRAVSAALARAGHTSIACGRGESDGPATRRWDATSGFASPTALDDVDAVVHLAGENIGKRWSARHKLAIRESRVHGTQTLVQAFDRARERPRVLVSASAVGYYGDCGDDLVDESRGPGHGFLAEVCQGWEAAAQSASSDTTRVAVLRFAMILSAQGGTLAKLLPLFRAGLGGRLGDGRQWMPWIHLDDVVAVILRALDQGDMHGAYNTCAPAPVRNAEFTATLAEAVSRPAMLPAPRFALRLALGEMADELLLAGQRAVPARLTAMGHRFVHPTLAAAITAALATNSPS